MATILQNLKLASVQRSRSHSPVQHRRDRLLSQISEQIEAATADAKGVPFVATQVRVKYDPVNGEELKGLMPKRFRRCWWITADGKCYLELRYATRKLEIAKGKTAVEVGAVANLVPTLELLRDAVLLGELDAQLDAASSRVAAQLKGKSRKSS